MLTMLLLLVTTVSTWLVRLFEEYWSGHWLLLNLVVG